MPSVINVPPATSNTFLFSSAIALLFLFLYCRIFDRVGVLDLNGLQINCSIFNFEPCGTAPFSLFDRKIYKKEIHDGFVLVESSSQMPEISFFLRPQNQVQMPQPSFVICDIISLNKLLGWLDYGGRPPRHCRRR